MNFSNPHLQTPDPSGFDFKGGVHQNYTCLHKVTLREGRGRIFSEKWPSDGQNKIDQKIAKNEFFNCFREGSTYDSHTKLGLQLGWKYAYEEKTLNFAQTLF